MYDHTMWKKADSAPLKTAPQKLSFSGGLSLVAAAAALFLSHSAAIAQHFGPDATKWNPGRPTPWLPNNGSPNYSGGIYTGTGGGGGSGGNYGYGNGHGFGPGNGWGGWGPQLFIGIDPSMFPSQGYIYYPSTASYNNLYNLNYGIPPTVTTPTPAVVQPLDANPNGMPGGFPAIQPVHAAVPASTPTEQETSQQFQTQGDLQLQRLNYLGASERYRKAISAARDRPDPRYRLAITLAARSRFMEAVDQLKLMVAIDPTFPQLAPSLEEVFGAENLFEKTRVKERVGEWALQDVRDPNRLFLLGALTYLDGQPESKQLLDTAVLIAGNEPHLQAFLMPRAVPIPPPAGMNHQNHGDKPGPGAAQRANVAPPEPNPPIPATPKPATAPPAATPPANGIIHLQNPVPPVMVPPSTTPQPPMAPQSPIPSIPPAPTFDTAPAGPPNPIVPTVVPSSGVEESGGPTLPPLSK